MNDSEGFMWIGTGAGLQRYDGTRFKDYLADIRDTGALQSDWISSIFEDSKKRLWVGTDQEGPYIFNRETGKFFNYNSHQLPANQVNGIWHFIEDKSGAVWIAGHRGYYRFNENTGRFEKYNSKLGMNAWTPTGGLLFDDKNNIWMGTGNGLYLFNKEDNRLYGREYNPFHNPLFDIKGGIGKMIFVGTELWVTAYKAIYRYNLATGKLKTFLFNDVATEGQKSIHDGIIGGLHLLQDSTILVSLPLQGLAVYQPEKDTFLITYADNTKPYAYHVNGNIGDKTCLAQDRENNTLIGNEVGIHIFNPRKQFFKTYGVNEKKSGLFPEKVVNDFIESPRGDIFIGYYDAGGGIVKMDSTFHFKKNYLYNVTQNLTTGVNQVWNLFMDTHGIIWAPNQRGTMLRLDPGSEEITEGNNAGSNNLITVIKQDEQGVIWMGHWSAGLEKRTADGTSKFFKQFLYSDSTNIKRVQSILIEKDKIWIGTIQNGLQVFDKQQEKFVEAFVSDQKNRNSISNNCVTDIIRYNRDTLLVATLMGINIFDLKHKTFRVITARDGLPNNLIQTIIKDDDGYIWAANYDNGLCKLNIHDLSITKYNLSDGLMDDIFTSKFYRLKNGKILIGASKSFLSFDPAAFKAAAAPANARITDLHIFDKEIMIDSLLKNDCPLALSYLQNSIRISFSSLQFWSQANIKYYYKLDGVDKDWVIADNSHTAVYNQLKNGKYNFHVKCANKDGIFCPDIMHLKIIIAPPFWKTWWFSLIASLLLAFLIYLFIKWREKHFRVIAAEKLQVQQLKAEQYKSKLELEQIINYFSSSLIDKNTVEDVLWDVAKNLIGQLGFVDCMIYLWNEDKTKMIQKAGFGEKDSVEDISKQLFDVLPGQGVVGYVMQTKEAVVIPDTSIDNRYRTDDFNRLSEITVPVIYNNELISVIDSEHPDKNFFTPRHLQVLSTIATLVATKIKSIEAEQLLLQTKIEMYSMNEQLSKAKLEALRSQMNPHFIFNSLNAIQECILTNKVDAAYEYLSKFSKLQRMVLNNSEKELIPLSSEIEMLNLYLSLESLRFSKSFSYSMDVAAIIDEDEVMIPSLITQPLVENAIWHGLRNKDGDKLLRITYEEKEGMIVISIEDNGIGREKAAIIKQQKLGSGQYASKGTMMLQQRLNVLSQQFNAKIQLETFDLKNTAGIASGTKVILSFPADLEIA